MGTHIIVFEDEHVGRLYPLSLGRAACEISCGSYCLVELLQRLDGRLHALVRPHVREILAAERPEVAVDSPWPSGTCLLVNARLVPRVSLVDQLRRLLDERRPGVVHSGGSVAAALCPAEVQPPGEPDAISLSQWVQSLSLPQLSEPKLPLLDYPHDLIRWHGPALAENLADRLARGNYREVRPGLFAAEGVTIGEQTVADAAHGPILLDRGVSIGPLCFLSGPVYVGPRSRVIEHASLKDAVALGHTTKIGGEVEHSIIEPYTNKQHHGFLGHSYVGSWVNLGAGTCNSDLKNTYGTVSMEYQGRKVATGMQFVGCLIGDYAKTAINTSIFTGKTIGACSMVYGFVTTNVPSFVNYARSFGQVTEVPVEVMIATQARMFERRRVPQRPCHIELIRQMYELTRHERQLAAEPLSL